MDWLAKRLHDYPEPAVLLAVGFGPLFLATMKGEGVKWLRLVA
jgi:hypothetical protein